MKDIIILVADLDIDNVLQGFLPRLSKQGETRSFSYDIFRHPDRDNGCAGKSHDFLRPFHRQYQKALVVFDREGSGQERKNREAIEAGIENLLAANGWAAENVSAIAIQPEVENWIWMDSPHIIRAFGWSFEEPLYDWLRSEKWLKEGDEKPHPPKDALIAALRKTRLQRSASIYKTVAEKAPFTFCTDHAFLKMLQKLKDWFPAD